MHNERALALVVHEDLYLLQAPPPGELRVVLHAEAQRRVPMGRRRALVGAVARPTGRARAGVGPARVRAEGALGAPGEARRAGFSDQNTLDETTR